MATAKQEKLVLVLLIGALSFMLAYYLLIGNLNPKWAALYLVAFITTNVSAYFAFYENL